MNAIRGLVTYISAVCPLSDNLAVTDLSLKALGKACRNLECISIAGCSKITDHGLKGLQFLKSLISLNVADCVRWVQAN